MEGNFKQRLLNLSEDFDDVFITLQKSYADEKLGSWFMSLLAGLFKQKSFIQILKATYPILITALVSLGIGFLAEMPILSKVISIVAAILLGGIVAGFLQFMRMIDLKDRNNFHIGAYRLAKRREYDLFIKYIPFDFSFTGLYDEVVTHNPSLREITIRDETIHKLTDEHNRYVAAAREQNIKLQNDIKDLQEQTRLIVDLVKEIITIFYQLTNGYFRSSSLLLFSGFTIYELDETNKVLHKIADHGTTGHSKDRIQVPAEIVDEHYAVIRALRHKKDRYEPELDTPYKNRFIVAFSMAMNNNITWIFNFHADEDNNKALFFLLTDSTIETREVYRLIHAHCLILQSQGGSRKCGEKLP
ncbi:hypothetical protein C2I18_03255 [Paenibacillus sp. PK3_47]|uniref:hypothetical protein n=1 Tax=Paenibacillus sp. PK3_47 TaxID=2072642 RepID=UPI00201DA302|nr:hypothetical protein [Paenibacillus sp. PK3_47]UQZ32660.1 hypothetical protein C2I18_03255 [Paenibacillus sp. PK3_47]